MISNKSERYSNTRHQTGTSFGNFRASETVVVRIEFRGPAAATVCSTLWHSSQVVVARSKETAELSFDLALTPELVGWVKSFGNEARVIEPAALLQALYQEPQGA